MLEISNKTNLLEQKSYKYSLQDVADPNLYRDIYPYDSASRSTIGASRWGCRKTSGSPIRRSATVNSLWIRTLWIRLWTCIN